MNKKFHKKRLHVEFKYDGIEWLVVIRAHIFYYKSPPVFWWEVYHHEILYMAGYNPELRVEVSFDDLPIEKQHKIMDLHIPIEVNNNLDVNYLDE